jgi:hypothetical protein
MTRVDYRMDFAGTLQIERSLTGWQIAPFDLCVVQYSGLFTLPITRTL